MVGLHWEQLHVLQPFLFLSLVSLKGNFINLSSILELWEWNPSTKCSCFYVFWLKVDLLINVHKLFSLSFYTHVWCSHRCLIATYSVFILRKYNRDKSYDGYILNTNLMRKCWIFKWQRRYVIRSVSYLRGIPWGQKPATESWQPVSVTP